MTDIEKKRETILNFIRAWGVIKHPYGSRDAEGCLAMLSDLGVVIMVKKPISLGVNTIILEDFSLSRNGVKYVAVEPLIKEDTNDQGTTVHTGKDNS